MRIVLFGTGSCARNLFSSLREDVEVVAAADNDPRRWQERFCGVRVLNPADLDAVAYDYIIVCSMWSAEIISRLTAQGISRNRIIPFYECRSEQVTRGQEEVILNALTKQPERDTLAFVTRRNSGCNSRALLAHVPEDIRADWRTELVTLESYRRNGSRYAAAFTTHMEGRFGHRVLNVETWHGFPLKTLGYLSPHPSDHLPGLNRHVSYVTSYSMLYSHVMSSAFGIDIRKFHVTGAPRNDFLKNPPTEDVLRRTLGRSCADKRLVYYLPTFRQRAGKFARDGENVLASRGDFAAIDRFCGERNLLFVVKAHPVEGDTTVGERYENIVFLKDDDLERSDIDLYGLLNGSVCLVTDYSSVSFDYLLTNKPLIFWSKDAEEYRQQRGFLFDDVRAFMPGPLVSDIPRLLDSIDRASDASAWYGDQRAAVRTLVHRYSDFTSSQRVWDLFRRATRPAASARMATPAIAAAHMPDTAGARS